MWYEKMLKSSDSKIRSLANRLLQKIPLLRRSSSEPLKLVENPNATLQAYLGKGNLNEWSEDDVLTWLTLLPLFLSSADGDNFNVSTEDVDLRWIPLFKEFKVTGKILSDQAKMDALWKAITNKYVGFTTRPGAGRQRRNLNTQIAHLREALEEHGEDVMQ